MKARKRVETRMLTVAVVTGGLFVLIAARAAQLAVLRGSDLARLAAVQHRQRVELVPRRGPIVDRHGESLALSVDVPSIYVRPREFAGQESRLPALAAALGMSPRALAAKLDTGQPFVWLRRQASPRDAERVRRLGLRGVHTVAESRRFYPHHSLAAHVLGLVGVDSQGLEGLEQRFDRAIRGEPRYVNVDRDARGREMFVGGLTAPPAQGSRVELTLDAGIQDAAERALAAGVAAARAAGGAAVVLDPATGEVLALANVPTYDPNGAARGGDPGWRDRIRNRAITDPHEPGSTLKAVLAAAAIEEKVIRPNELLFCEKGRLKIGKWVINDAHPRGWLTFAEVIQYSSNIGATKVAERLGRERYAAYLGAFGFGTRTGIELPGETAGIIRPKDSIARIDLATMSFGQGIAVTPLQMAVAFGAIANQGQLMRPFLVRRVVTSDGAVTFENRPVVARRVVSPETARVVTGLLRRVVEGGGTGSQARLEGFPVAGKTGTAQKVNLQTGGYSSKRIGSFVGFVPADAPRAVILVLIDEPRTSSYGGVVAAPVFREIAGTVLKRLGVNPLAPTPPAPKTPEVRLVDREGGRPPAAVPRPEAVRTSTPSFLGLSLREALAQAHRTGWDLQLIGMGYVREQKPPPGTPLAGERRLALWLGPEDGTASP